VAYSVGTTPTSRDSVTTNGDFVTAALLVQPSPVVYEGTVTCGSTAGNFQYQWAQSVSGTALTVAANSYLLMKLLV
jgi:hypothetical protein